MASIANNSGIKVSVETLTENQIVEVGYDGTEVVQPPPTLSELLTRQVAKIDFDQEDDDDDEDGDSADDGRETAEDDDDGDDKGSVVGHHRDESFGDEGGSEHAAQFSNADKPGGSSWPWESTRNKLRNALTELCVLSDVLAVATKECGKDRRYMVLDGPVAAEAPESRPLVTLLAKKKSLDAPARILLGGAEQLKALLVKQEKSSGQVEADTSSSSSKQQPNSTKGSYSEDDFHKELLRLRQNWRLKKVSNTILGDLSYRTAGSLFKQCSGIFEVVKADSKSSSPSASALKVIVPSELEGVAFIQVVILKEFEHLASSTLNGNAFASAGMGEIAGGDTASAGSCSSGDAHWQQVLETAQNVLFCKELFSQLAREAIQLQAPIPHLVVGNQITSSLFPGSKLIITLVHNPVKGNNGPGDRKPAGTEDIKTIEPQDKTFQPFYTLQHVQRHHRQLQRLHPPSVHEQLGSHSHVLEHSLHQLLRMAHQRNIGADQGTSLSSAPAGIPKRRRLAGPSAASRKDLVEMATSETLLEQVVRQARHIVLREGTMVVLDTLAKELKDPLISCHWTTLNSPTQTSVKVSITTAGYDTILKTQLVIHVGEKKLTVVCKDGRVLHFSHEPDELRDFILLQISQHQINGVQALAKCTGWQILSSSIHHLGCGQVERLGSAAGCLMASPTGEKLVAVRHIPQCYNGTVIYVASSPNKSFCSSDSILVADTGKWENPPDEFKEVHLNRMDGKNLLNKLELLMAALSKPY